MFHFPVRYEIPRFKQQAHALFLRYNLPWNQKIIKEKIENACNQIFLAAILYKHGITRFRRLPN